MTSLPVLVLLLAAAPLVGSEAEEATVYTVTIDYEVQNTGFHEALNVQARIYLFDNQTGWADQEVVSESITVDGSAVFPQISDEEDNRWFRVSLGDLGPGQWRVVRVTQGLKVKSVGFSIDPDLVGTSFPPELAVYTQPVENLFENDPSILELAWVLTENTQNPYLRAKQIFDFLTENLTYETQLQEHGALWTLANGKGDCSDFSTLFVALARAAGIPAKIVSGNAYSTEFTLPGRPMDINDAGHAWVIFYVPGYESWVPVDLTWPIEITERGEIDGRLYIRGEPIGSFGEADYSHIVGTVIGGEGIVKGVCVLCGEEFGFEEAESLGWLHGEDGGQITPKITWPGPGQVSTNWEYYRGKSTTVSTTVFGSIQPEVLLKLEIDTSAEIENEGFEVTVTVTNMGKSMATDLSAELKLDESLFEVVTGPLLRSTLARGESWAPTFDVRIKDDNAYGARHQMHSEVTFYSTYGGGSGPFLVKGERTVTIGEKAEPEIVFPFGISDLWTFILLVILAVAVGAGVAALLHR